MLPAAAREGLTRHLADVRRLHERDLARGFGRVILPFALDRKFPKAATEWRWQFVFPAGRICCAGGEESDGSTVSGYARGSRVTTGRPIVLE